MNDNQLTIWILMKRLCLVLFSILMMFSQTLLEDKQTIEMNLMLEESTTLSEHFYVNYTIGKQATENVKQQFYMLSFYDMQIIGARNATMHNMNWAQQIHDEQKNMYFRGINPIGLLVVMAAWSGLVPDPSTQRAFLNSKKHFLGDTPEN